MALVKLGPVIQAISGKLGTVVFHAGARANVIARSPHTTNTRTQAQLHQRAALQAWNTAYQTLLPETLATWRLWARATPRPNRLAIPRNIGPRASFTSYCLLRDPNFIYTATPPSATFLGISDAPSAVVLDFTASGPYNVTITTSFATQYTEGLWLQRHTDYGGRAGPGSRTFIHWWARTTPTLNWYSSFQALGIALATGEHFTLTLRYIRFYRYTSAPIFVHGVCA
jgi:hypothetical protein